MNAVEDRLAALLSDELAPHDTRESATMPLVAAAEAHGVSALLWLCLSRGPGHRAQAFVAATASLVRAGATRDLLVQRELGRVLEALATEGVRALVVKGAALAYTVYAESWQRPRTDSDLLVAPADEQRAGAVLERCGYRRSDAVSSGAFVSHQTVFERTEHGMHHVIDLHRKLVNPQVLADVLPFELLWSTARPAPALGRAARVPSLEASTILACVHRLAHHQDQERLIWLYDLKLLANAMQPEEWDALTALACSRRVAGLCLDGLCQAARRVRAVVPPRVEAALAAAAPGEPSARYLEQTVLRRHVLVDDLSMLPSWRARLRLIREHAFPPSAFVMARYEARHRLMLPALYAHRLVAGAWRWLRE